MQIIASFFFNETDRMLGNAEVCTIMINSVEFDNNNNTNTALISNDDISMMISTIFNDDQLPETRCFLWFFIPKP